MSALLLLAGLALLLLGGEFLVRGAAGLARAAGLPPLAIGLTVVALGSSAPELAAAVAAARQGKGDLVFGNVAGSNLFNTLAILGCASLLAPLAVPKALRQVDGPLMAGATLLLAWFFRDGVLGRGEGLVLLLGLGAYVAWTFRTDPPEAPPLEAGVAAHMGKAAAWGWMGLGLAGLVLGADLLVEGAVALARGWGVSELLIGLTIVAAGTSAPELVASGVATWRGERDLAVGNVVGSNLFNVLGVMGTAALAAPDGVRIDPAALRFDLPLLCAVSLASLPLFWSGRLTRPHGWLLLSGYAVYTAFLVAEALQSPAGGPLRWVILWVYLPLVGLGLAWPWVGNRLRPPKVT